MNRGTGRFFPRPTQAATDFEDTVDVTAAEADFNQCRPQTTKISSTLTSSARKEDVNNLELKSVADFWTKECNGMKKAACWAFFMAQEGPGNCDASTVPLHFWICSENDLSRGRLVWNRENGKKDMLNQDQVFQNATLESYEARLVTDSGTKKRKTAEMLAKMNKYGDEKRCG